MKRRANLHLLGALVEHSPNFIGVADLDQNVIFVNEAGQRLVGLDGDEEAQRTRILDYFREEDRTGISDRAIPDVLAKGHWDGEVCFQHFKTGRLIPVLWNLFLISDAQTRAPAFYACVSTDLSERREAEATIGSLLQISRRLNSTLDVEVLMDALVTEAIRLVGAESGFAGLRTPEGMVCRHYFYRDEVVPLAYCFPPGHGLPGWLILHKVPYLTNDARTDPQIVPEMRQRFGIRSAISTPILGSDGEAIGFFAINNKDGDTEFTQTDLEHLMAISEAAAVAVQNVLAYQKIQNAEKTLRELSTRLLSLQDEERRRIARKLHETTVQNLIALKMDLALAHKSAARLPITARKALAESLSLVDQCISETRTLSHLLHPPLLDEAGLAPALRWYVTGFAQRSGLRVDLDLPSELPRLLPEAETTLFRVVQECLTNVHRHSGSPTAKIRIVPEHGTLVLEIEDEGRGMPPGVLESVGDGAFAVGVGIAGMRERARQLGGRLEIDSGSHGTKVRVRLPSGGAA